MERPGRMEQTQREADARHCTASKLETKLRIS